MDGTEITARSMRPRSRHVAIALLLAFLAPPAIADDADDARWARDRAAMVRTIEEIAVETASETGRTHFSADVMAAMRRVPRHRFVPDSIRDDAYENRPLAIGYGQTISQPYIVALMTDLLEPRSDHRVLEVGTGSGYQAAVLGELVREVYTVEIVGPLATRSTTTLRSLGYARVQTRSGDGYYGWPERAPFDSIIVTAAASSVPPPLVQQLANGGRMVIPVGGPFFTQTLILITKDANGRISTRRVLPVQFVPLTGGPR